MIEMIEAIGSYNVECALGTFLSNMIISSRDKLSAISITEKDKIVCLCAEILECYKIAEKNDFTLCDRR